MTFEKYHPSSHESTQNSRKVLRFSPNRGARGHKYAKIATGRGVSLVAGSAKALTRTFAGVARLFLDATTNAVWPAKSGRKGPLQGLGSHSNLVPAFGKTQKATFSRLFQAQGFPDAPRLRQTRCFRGGSTECAGVAGCFRHSTRRVLPRD